MWKSLMKGLRIGGFFFLLVIILAACWFLCRKKASTSKLDPTVSLRGISRDPAYEAAVQADLLACAKASQEEYLRLRDALILKARANPEAFRRAALLSPSWEQRTAGEIVMDYVLHEDGIKGFADWQFKGRRIKTREQLEPTFTYGNDFAEHARGAPMVLAESLWKGTNEKVRSNYVPISRWNQEMAAQALGVLKERRAREVLEWFMLDILEGVPDSANATAARALGMLGCSESVPALLEAIEKGVYGGSVGIALKRCADVSSLPTLGQAATTSTNEEVRATASQLIQELESRREGSSETDR